MNNQGAEIAEQFDREVTLLKSVGDTVVWHFFERQVGQVVLCDELIKTIRRDDCQRRDVDFNIRKGSGIDLLRKEIFDEYQSPGLAAE